MRRDPSGRSVGDRLGGTVVVRRATPADLEQRVRRRSPSTRLPGAGGMPGTPGSVSRVRRPRVRLASAPWGLRDVALASLIALGPLVAINLVRPVHLSLTATAAAAALVLVVTVVQDGWFVGWGWGFSLRRYGLGLAHWGFRRPSLAILWLVPLGLLICVAAQVAQAPFARGPARNISDLFPHTVAGGLLLLLASCVCPGHGGGLLPGLPLQGAAEVMPAVVGRDHLGGDLRRHALGHSRASWLSSSPASCSRGSTTARTRSGRASPCTPRSTASPSSLGCCCDQAALIGAESQPAQSPPHVSCRFSNFFATLVFWSGCRRGKTPANRHNALVAQWIEHRFPKSAA